MLGLAFKRDTDDERDSLSHKLVRLLERELADVAVHDPHVADADAPLERGGARRRRGRRRHQPPGVLHARTRCAASSRARERDALVVDPWNRSAPAQVFALRRRGRRCYRRRPHEPTGPRHRRRRHDRRGGRPPPARATPAYEVRVSDQREAPQWMREGCEVHTGDLRELDEARKATARLLARHPPGGDRRRDRATSTSCPTR